MSFWKKLFGNKESKKDQPAAISPNVSQEACLALFIFNSDNISSNVSSTYGNYAQTEILKALSEVVKSTGGWATYSSLILGCDGDLFEKSMMGKTPSLRVLSDWLRERTYGIDGSCVDSQLLTNIKRHQNLNYIPYVVGIGPIEKSYALDVHQKLKAKSPVGYLGLFTLSGAIDIPDLDNLLYLPQHMKIKGNKCTGWLVSSDDLHETGLVESE